jgi:phosphohistidine phosphatase
MTLVLMRHAKSAYPPGVPDVLRPLNDRGRRNADRAADILKEFAINTALVSAATRTRETWARISHMVPATVQYLDELYHADPVTIMDVVHRLGSGTTLVLAHNPGIQECVLQETTVDSPLRRAVAERFPTSAIARIEQGELLDFVIPR